MFVLKAPIASKRLGKPIWFHHMTGIGPKTTADPSERAEYGSREAAMQSPAMRHALSVFDIEEEASR